MLRRMPLLLVAIALLAVAVVIAADERESASSADVEAAVPARVSETRVGRVQGTEAYIALTYDGRRLRAYACDGSARRPATLSAWFEAAWDGREPITIVADGARLRVERLHVAGRIAGRLDGHRFTAEPATRSAGLRRLDSARWIVLADGSVRGALVDPRPRKCRPVQVTLADGTTQIVTVCKAG
jgi:hypothetical protein